ncbi:pilus assembly protein PilY [Acinetobacter sp. NIPH1876]|uniref:pilus assembly protein n=1 Tax=unclassified Acinetobacter TaxID=196816 RepID=UPI00148FA5CC|nr:MULTISPECIES: PilC/PilY family type IV pilus protein [unclassified Acinetobacter]MCJ0829124.1 pilus assembly protein PilY [Acinetobacter sp. NIPH1876]NNP67085.1 pilus assembly protein PilY [Acinetobacter sp. Ac_5812]
MKIMKLKKLVVACQAAAMTIVTSVAVSTQASDVELYKAPQTSETTLMFMLDVSGSMSRYFNSQSGYGCDLPSGATDFGRDFAVESAVTGVTPYRRQWCKGDYSGSIKYPDRITRLKDGMLKLLQGDTDTTRLPDNLAVGLSEFGGINGRIKLEARPLSDNVDIGNGQLYRTVETIQWIDDRTRTRTRTKDTSQTLAQKGTRTQNCTTTDGTRTGGSKWCNVSTVINWIDNGNWTPDPVNPSGNTGWSGSTDSSWISREQTITTVREICKVWDTSNNCSTWERTTNTVPTGATASPPNETTIQYGAVNTDAENTNNYQTSYLDKSPSAGSCTTNSQNCTRNLQRTATVKQTGITAQRRDASYTRTTLYLGTVYRTHRQRMIDAVISLQANNNTPTAFAYAEAAAYMMGATTKNLTSTGFTDSIGKTAIQDGNKYLAPSRVTSAKQCNTQGIYFLTDGEPNYSNNSGNYTTFMKSTLGTKGADFNCSTSYLHDKTNSWDCIGNYAKALLDTTKNPAGVLIKTAVVGFGKDFGDDTSTDSDILNAKKWGEVGQGGWYPGQSSADVVESVKRFLKKLQKYIPPVTTGSVTIPVDNLDTQNIQPWGYFPQFDPRPDLKVTTWVGNLKKYQVLNNTLKDQDGADVMITSGTGKGQSVDNPNDYWADQNIMREITKVKQVNGIDEEETIRVRVGGALSRLLLGSTTTTGTDPVTTERKIFTDRKLSLAVDNTTYVAQPITDGDLIQIKTADLKINNPDNNFNVDSKRGYVAALFGYDVSSDVAASITDEANTAFNNFLNNTNATLRQMGAVMHSKPILITQKGTTKYDKDTETISYDNRDDLIAFGTTQGVLHVVRAGKSATDSDAGKEIFSFVPSEMIDRQAESFIGQQDDPSATLRYGIDGQWTAYTEYATKSGEKTNEPIVSVASANGGKQWLYGGLRMGGKSYYSLDLSNVTSTSGTPKLKFRINPTGICSATNGLGCMGQSWSKPSIAWVNWQGKRKLVMFVGGGYDSIYESSADYTPSSSYIDQGAGVYMFDANDGSLLWWASANAGSTNTDTERTYAADMKRSVVGNIKTVDRNSDGLVDHLYFGDLGGQVWRIDLNASAKAGVATDDSGEKFATRAVRILDMSGATKVPRFYNAPTFTIHNSTNGLFAAVTIGSGNLSYPMSAGNNADDAVYVIYDKDVTRRNLPVLATKELYTQDVKPSGEAGKNLVKNTNGNTETALSNGGWYYPVGTKKRILNESVAIDSDLYVSIFDSSKDITNVDCYGGVRGESNATQFCLPYGECKKKNPDGSTGSDNRPNDIFLGKGNVGISFGGINRDRGIVLNLPTNENLKKYTGKTKFVSQRWYER